MTRVLALLAVLGASAWAQPPPETQPAQPARPRVTLSMFEPSGGACEWRRIEPPRTAAVVAKFDGDCAGARVAWSPSVQQALVWFDPAMRTGTTLITDHDAGTPQKDEPPSVNATPRLWLVEIQSGATRSVPLPSPGVLKTVAFDRQGRATALTMQTVTVPENGQAHALTFEGTAFPMDPDLEGIPVLVHAYRLTSENQWKLVETKASTTGSDVAPEVQVLAAARGLSTRSTELLSPHLEAPVVKDAALLKRLRQAAPELIPGDEGGWVQVAARPGRVLIWQANVEFTFTTGRVFFLAGGQLVSPPQLDRSAKDITAVVAHDPYVLVTTDTVGTRPRLYDLGSLQLVFKSDRGWATTYWPTPRESP